MGDNFKVEKRETCAKKRDPFPRRELCPFLVSTIRIHTCPSTLQSIVYVFCITHGWNQWLILQSNSIGFFYPPDHQVALGMQQLLDQMTPFSVERSTQTANFTWKEKLLLQRKQQNKFGHSSSWREVRLQQQEIQAYINYTRRRRQSWNSVTLQTLLKMYSLLPI